MTRGETQAESRYRALLQGFGQSSLEAEGCLALGRPNEAQNLPLLPFSKRLGSRIISAACSACRTRWFYEFRPSIVCPMPVINALTWEGDGQPSSPVSVAYNSDILKHYSTNTWQDVSNQHCFRGKYFPEF